MDKRQILKNAIEEVKQKTGLDDDRIKQLFLKEYFIEDDKSANNVLADWLKKQVK